MQLRAVYTYRLERYNVDAVWEAIMILVSDTAMNVIAQMRGLPPLR